MLSKNQVVAVRKAIESTYTGICTITEWQRIKQPNKTTDFVEVMVLENQPCKLSFSSLKNAVETDIGTAITQTVKIFLAPEVKVKTGSKISITQNGITTEYKNSGEPSMFATHQEIMVELFRGWA